MKTKQSNSPLSLRRDYGSDAELPVEDITVTSKNIEEIKLAIKIAVKKEKEHVNNRAS